MTETPDREPLADLRAKLDEFTVAAQQMGEAMQPGVAAAAETLTRIGTEWHALAESFLRSLANSDLPRPAAGNVAIHYHPPVAVPSGSGQIQQALAEGLRLGRGGY